MGDPLRLRLPHRDARGSQRWRMFQKADPGAGRDANDQIIHAAIENVTPAENTANARNAKIRIFHVQTADDRERDICQIQRRACENVARDGVAIFGGLHHDGHKFRKYGSGTRGKFFDDVVPVAAIKRG
jgi:hypothetical protein